ncbi:MAG: hypothetical protein ABR567_21460 [Myxococcales bacterium]|nr:hypothetical protein [Myxococcales bacterium]
MPRQPLHGLLDNFIDQFASAIAARAEAMLAKTAGGRPRPSGGAGKKRSFPCPYPGCRNPGNGPRFRWFCKTHMKLPVREQNRILAERVAKNGGASLTVRKRGASPMKGRKLDLHCRVEGCKNMSRGPRFGFICDEHRKKLSAKEQQAARDKWKAARAKAA